MITAEQVSEVAMSLPRTVAMGDPIDLADCRPTVAPLAGFASR